MPECYDQFKVLYMPHLLSMVVIVSIIGLVFGREALTELIEDGRNEGKDEKLRELVEKKVKRQLRRL